MARYFIFEGNFDRLAAQLKRIENKCVKYGLQFKFEVVGTEYREIKTEDGTIINAKYLEVEVEGLMRHNDWEFVAKVDHYSEGNIIRQFKTDIEVPERYCFTKAVCEHCNTSRGRKFTYLIHNTANDDWKQVGSSCLREFTGGLDAEDVARYISGFDSVIKGETPLSGISYNPYYTLRDYLCYAKETINKLGYVSRAKEEETGDVPTSSQAWEFYRALTYRSYFDKAVIEKARDIGFNPDTDEIREYVDGAINWIRSIGQDELQSNSFLFSLHLACSEDYFPIRNLGFVTSLLPTYYRHLAKIEYEARKKAEVETNPSRYQGEIGKRLEFKPVSITCVCSNDSYFGISYLYRILDEAGNVYMWSTGTCIEEDKEFKSVRGTVKGHSEYRGVQQTFLTRCKIA